jgi:BirA family biotin operon repressor/biotin-[acetyl-CoA-carboxylase] ligase
VAVAIHEFFGKYAGADTSIKWPNDIYWRDRKAGGVLIETGGGMGVDSPESAVDSRQSAVGSQQSTVDIQHPGSSKWAIIGIGININQTTFPAEIRNPVSLKQITGKEFDTIELAKELCGILEKKYTQLNTQGFDGIYEYYQEHLYKKNGKVRLKKNNRVFDGILKGVTKKGRLIVQHAIEEEFDFGKVEWVL